jgi:hypothetical protein
MQYNNDGVDRDFRICLLIYLIVALCTKILSEGNEVALFQIDIAKKIKM